MKRLPVVYSDDKSGKDYWRSLGEQAGDADVRASLPRELPEGAAEPPSGTSRREMLALMGASVALSGLEGCRRPEEKIVPYAHPPEDVVPGNPLYFATAMQMYGTSLGLIVESHEGRPTKVEGNPRHPETVGSTDRFAQASVLDLYDPCRSDGPSERGESRSWTDAAVFLRQLGTRFKANGGKGLAVITEGHRSPTTAAALADLKTAMPEARVVRYEPFYQHNARAGAEIAFGTPFEPVYNVVHAQRLVTLDADILGTEHAPTRQARGFANGRRGEGGAPFNRLYAVESSLSITGANADHRLRMRSSDIGMFALALLHEVGFQAEVQAGLKQASANAATHLSPQAAKWVKTIAADLSRSKRGTTLVVAGRKQPPAVHAITYAINLALGNVGYTLHFFAPFDPASEGPQGLVALTKDMRAGAVDSVIILGGNPVFNAPADAEFAAALAKVPNSVSLSAYVDETSAASSWHVNRAHYLEAWNDVMTQTGTYSVVQPLIAPLYGGKTDAEVVRALLGDQRSAYGLMRASFDVAATGVAQLDKAFHRCLYDGFIPKSYQPQMPVERVDALALAARDIAPGPEGVEVTFEPDPHAHDGRFANNSWLLEWPDPVYKETWGNAAALSAKTATRFGVNEGDEIDVRVGGATVRLPVLIAPGQADDSVRIYAGLGRVKIGAVRNADGEVVRAIGEGVGVNTFPLRASGAFEIATGVQVTRAGTIGTVARTQEHFLMEGRPMVRETSIDKFKKDPKIIKAMVDEPEQVSIWDEQWEYKGHKWGMSIDLNACIGCGVCMLACQAENNIPVVGVKQVLRSREMHWLRVDRYFEGDIDDPKSVTQPMPCQQCENAPCESVCPVGATTHSPEGLNDMAYNRCIGTRYCLNNCPFKVRRFNFFNYRKEVHETEKMVMNPDVTVRSRGVMEKCTFCVQRINEAKIAAKRSGRPRAADGTAKVQDGTILSACQQACPTDAILFGDLNDPNSRVAKVSSEPRAYKLLSELNVRPRVSYLAKLRNPNPELEFHMSIGTSAQLDLQCEKPDRRAPLVLGDESFTNITEQVANVVERKMPKPWLLAFGAAASLLLILLGSIVDLVGKGIGEWGNNNPVGWAWDITGFVFWIGIGHAGTLISAILYLFRQKWRTGVNRAAEAMTIFAVMAAGLYPAFHVGRVWLLYWVFPVPNQMSVWPNFKSPLLWDVFAVSTYATVSVLFWYVGLVPDLATLRDRAKTRLAHTLYGIFALGWRGSHRGWLNYEKAYLILAGISTPLVLSVHTIVSFDFAVSVIPGWHTTIFPPYFVAGAVFSGFAMVMTLMLVVRKAFNLENLVTMRHLENMNKIILVTGSMVGYAYAMEFFIAWYSGNEYERYAFINRAFGPYKWAYWTMVSCNVIFPQLFWWKKIRTSIPIMFVICVLVNIGMWFERFVIIVTSLHRDFIPASWSYFRPRTVDISMFVGSFGLFLTMFMLFIRYLPSIAISEVKGITKEADPHHGGHSPDHDPGQAASGATGAVHAA